MELKGNIVIENNIDCNIVVDNIITAKLNTENIKADIEATSISALIITE